MTTEDYEVVEFLGQGGFGTAVKARRKADDVIVVLKQVQLRLLRQIQHNPQMLKMARNEAAIMAKFDHPNIVKIVDVFEDIKTNILHIVMEYCAGGDLEEKINQQKLLGNFSEEQIMAWFTTLALAVKHLHDNKIIHRDIKSQNVFFADRECRSIKLGDFGIAKLRETFSKDNGSTTVTGTLCYMPPEAFDGINDYKRDVWSLGVLLYELAMLELPFYGDNTAAVYGNIIKGRRKLVPNNFSADFRNLIDAMLEINLDKRPSMAEIVADKFTIIHLAKQIDRGIKSQNEAEQFRTSNNETYLVRQLANSGDNNLAKIAILNDVEHSLDETNLTELTLAVLKGDFDKIRQLVTEYFSDVNQPDKRGLTPIAYCAEYGCTCEIARFLLERGAAVNAKTNDGWTPLMIATWNNQLEMMHLLLGRGADINSTTTQPRQEIGAGWTALHIAAYKGELKLVQLLLSYHPISNMKNADGKTAFQLTSNPDIKNLLKQ